MTIESKQQLRQIKFRAQSEINNLKEEVKECNKRLYPKNSEVKVKKGRGVSAVIILGFDDLSDPEKFRGRNAITGQIHWYDTSEIVE